LGFPHKKIDEEAEKAFFRKKQSRKLALKTTLIGGDKKVGEERLKEGAQCLRGISAKKKKGGKE